jgi:GH35 family endo-1,4-beta-xylanase
MFPAIYSSGAGHPQKLPKVIKLIQSLKAKGLRIDAVGIQGHWPLAYPDVKVIDAALSAFEKKKIKVMITELDVDVLPRGKALKQNHLKWMPDTSPILQKAELSQTASHDRAASVSAAIRWQNQSACH